MTGQETPGHLTAYALSSYAREQIIKIITRMQAQTHGEHQQRQLKLPAMTVMTTIATGSGIMILRTGVQQEMFQLTEKAIVQ